MTSSGIASPLVSGGSGKAKSQGFLWEATNKTPSVAYRRYRTSCSVTAPDRSSGHNARGAKLDRFSAHSPDGLSEGEHRSRTSIRRRKGRLAMTLPVFVINLDRRPDRWRMISDSLGRIGVSAQRISAIDAESMTDQDKSMHLGEKACVLSHCKALHAFLATDHPAALILEDDVELASDVTALLGGKDWWPVGAKLLKLDNPGEKPRLMGPARGRTPTSRGLHRVALSQAGGGAYLLDRQAAATVLDACKMPFLPIDVLLFDLRRSKTARQLRPLQIVPAMGIHDHEGSDIEPWRQAAGPSRIGWPRRLELASGSLLQKARVFVLRIMGKVRRYPLPYEDQTLN